MIPIRVEGITSADLRNALVGGVVGRCVVCPNSSAVWLDLLAIGTQPVTDRHGHLTDHVALHPGCCSTLIEFWSTLDDQGGPGDVTLPGDGPAHPTPAQPVQPSVLSAPRMPRLGAYASRP